MPWQRYVADVGCEFGEDGRPAYREVIVTVPRQSGKTTLFLAWQLDRCLNWRQGPQRSAFTAQTGKDARDKWLDELNPLLKQSRLMPLVARINEGMGNESVRFKTGSIIRLLSTSASSGHSKTLHQAVLDEIWHDVDDRREQGLRPAMITVPDAQLLVCSTAGTHLSTVYNRKVQVGRAATGDPGAGVAYFEWSAPDDWDPSDEDSWWTFMPALGHTISPEAIRAELEAMDPAEFRRAYGNRPTGSVDTVIHPEIWRRAVDRDATPTGTPRFGLDVAEDRSSAAVALCGANGVVELVDHRSGTGWCIDRVNQLTGDHDATVAVDHKGPAGVLADNLHRCQKMPSTDVVSACVAMYDAILDAAVTFRQDDALDAAVTGVVKRPVGDNWVWSRRASTADVTPLMAATLARAATPKATVAPWMATD